ncbi:TonB-dependent receptor plug domain-containing protein [Thalassolituus sp. LLYu03]|uniref:TonB-dependent receptor plug domain-containing protein n=1 Tax=Thalassolituus sp. LLYu03 TaxID=3421656 RepID=UPI003D2D01FF
MNAVLPLTLLWGVPAATQALPQSVAGVAYPQEIYYTRDLRFYAPMTLLDLLRQLPGITVGWQPDGQAEIQLHGIDGRYLSILINGQPLLGAGGNNVLTTRQIPASLVNHIEIDRSARADLHQGGASAGTINVILNDAYQNDGLLLSAGGTVLNTRVAGAVHLHDGENPVRLSAEQRLLRDESGGATEADGFNGDWQAFDRELSRDLLLSFNTLLNDRHPFSLYLMQLKGDGEQRLTGSYPLNRPSTEIDPDLRDVRSEREYQRTTQRIGSDMSLSWGHLAFKAWGLAEQFDQDMSLSQNLPVAAAQTTQIDDSRYQFGASLSETRYEHHWSVGLSVEQSKRVHGSLSDAILTSNSERSGLPYQYDLKENMLSAFALDRWDLSPSTEFEAGVHVDTYEISLDPDTTGESEVATDTHWLPTLHLMHRLGPGKRLRISASQSNREPDLADRVPYEFRQGTTVWRGNGELEPELISNIDVGYEQNFQRPASALSDRNSGFYLRAFQRIFNRTIYESVATEVAGAESLTVLMPKNAPGNAILRGAELDLEFYPGIQDLRLDLGAGLYHSQMQTTEELTGRYRLTNQPDYMLRIGLHHQPLPGLRYGGNWHAQGGSEQLLPGDTGYVVQRTSDIQSLDLYAEYQWSPSWHVLLTAHMTPGPSPWQEQGDIRQYRDFEPTWQLVLMGVY